MGYQALYRKYRPKTFQEVYGQTSVVDTLKNIIESNNTTHAYLFSGPRGTGKTTLARIFAKGLQCTSDNKPCCKCQSCLDAERGIHSDIIEMDGASNNGVDEIRDLREKMKYAPTTSKYKIYIIDEVHMLTTGAFNALLKTLEEPPEHVVFMMATTELYKVPATILSRCMRFELQELSDDNLVKGLTGVIENEQLQADEDALKLIAKEAKGGFRDSLTLLEQVISYAHHERLTLKLTQEALGGIDGEDIRLFRQALCGKDVQSAFSIMDRVDHTGKKIDDFIEQCVQSIVQDENSKIEEISATKALLKGLRNYRYYRQGALAIKAEVLQFMNKDSRLAQLEKELAHLRGETKYVEVTPPVESIRQEIVENTVQEDSVEEQPDPVEDIKPIALEVYHEKSIEEKEEQPPAFLKVHGATKESTVEDMKTRNDIYKSILKDTQMQEAMSGEPLTLMRDEMTKEALENFSEKNIFQEIEITNENKGTVPVVSQDIVQEITPNQNLMRVLIEAALFPEKSPIKYIKRRWILLQSLPGNYFTKLLEDTEVRAASENVVVISCYLESVKQELEKIDVRFEVTKIIKENLKIDMPYIVVTENEWLKTRSLFVEQWKQGVIDEDTLKAYQASEQHDPGIVEGQIGFDIEEMESQEAESVQQAKALFGDIVEVV